MKYTGRLAKPISRGRIGLLDPPEAVKAEAKRIVEEMLAKFPDLFAAHAVADGDWIGLALALAKCHVPGFRVIESPGRPTEWSAVDRAELWLEVESVLATATTPSNHREALKLATRREPWKSKTAKMKLESIEKQYYLADERYIRLVENARAYESMVARGLIQKE